MWEWLERRRQRDLDIANGADADLFRENRKHWSLAWRLFAILGVLFVIEFVLPLSGIWRSMLGVALGLFALGAKIVADWSRTEENFLERPDPKPPLSLFSRRR